MNNRQSVVCELRTTDHGPRTTDYGLRTMKRILSGIQPSGKLHLGNYFGAIRQHIALQDEAECFYFIADYHALTTLKDAEEKELEEAHNSSGKIKPRKAAAILRDNVRDVALDYLALGLDPDK